MNYLYTRKFAHLLTVVFIALGLVSNAQLGKIDTAYYRGKGIDYKCTGGLVLSDNSLIVTGRFAYANESQNQCIVKLMPDGSTDNSFAIGSGADDHVNVVVRQPDGKYIIGGDFIQFNGQTKNRLARLNADGSTDATFNTGTGFNGSVYAICLQPDGKILMGGTFYTYNGDTLAYIVRLNANGTRDTTFNIGTGFSYTVYSIERQSDGKYIVGGDFASYNGSAVSRIARLDVTGALDNTFNLGGAGADGIVTVATILPNGKIIVAGYFTNYNGLSSPRIVRLNSDGSTDGTFSVGAGFNQNVNELCVQTDGKIMATGNFTTYKGASITRIIRIDTAGNRDITFNPGTGPNSSCNTVFMNPDGKVYIGGFFTLIDSFARLHFARLLPTGKVDHSFFYDSKLNNQILAIAFQKNGKAIIGGQFTKYNSITANRIARLTNDGSLDPTFSTGAGANNIIRTIAILPNDKILIGGDFTTYDGVARNRIAQLNADGTLDNSFVVGTGAQSIVYSIVIASGKIIIGGKFTSYNGTPCNRIAQLTSTGAYDNSLVIGTGFSNIVYKLLVQPDGNILAGGAFTSYKGTAQNRITRLTPLGAIDAGFNIGAGASGNVLAMTLQPDGKIIIAGAFTKYNAITHNRIARLNADGTLDGTYNASIGSQVNDLVFVNNTAFFTGGVLVGGVFTLVNNVACSKIIFLDNTGTIDNINYYTGSGLESTLTAMAINPVLRKIFIGGDFKGAQSRIANRLAGLRNTYIDLENVSPILCPGAIAKVYFNKAETFYGNNNFIVQLSDSSGDFTNAINVGTQSSVDIGHDSITINIPGNTPAGSNYLVRIISTNPNDTSSISSPILITTPTAQTVSASGPTTFCSGGNVILSVPAGGNYTWSNGEHSAEIIVTQSGSYGVTADYSGCAAASSPTAVTVDVSPDSSVAISNIGLCGGGNAILTAATGLTYSWSNTETTQTINISQSGSYTVSVTGSNGCGADSTFYFDFAAYFDSTLITVAGPTTFCQGGSVILSSLSGFSYSWSNGTSMQSTTITASGDYVVIVSDGGCADTSDIIHVTVNAPPSISFSLPSDTICSNSGVINLSATPNGGTFTGNGVTGTTFDPQTFSGTSVSIMYDYTDGNFCSNSKSDTVFVDICTGVNEIADNTISIFPNPAKNALFINSSSNDLKNLEILNLFGQTMLKLNNGTGQSHLSLDISFLATGTYILKAGGKKFRFVKAE
ncbi:MAG: T9SS type A sorting domain-containing protein [Bacteroidetes bacterium]|nr:T9SS type A sorting domain-containing protein [Bacteroidota bacterium]